jgi:hypothetical protein
MDLVAAVYHLQIQYKSFVVEKEIQIPSDDESLVFPAEFPVSFRVFDERGMALNGVMIQLSRGGKTTEKTLNGAIGVFSIPPGLYVVKVLSQGNVIGQRYLTVINKRNVDLVTNQQPIFQLILLFFACSIVVVGFFFSIMKKEPLTFLLFLMMSILILAIFFPWWSLQGSSLDVQTTSTLYLVPLELVSTTITSQVIAGELAFFPEMFISVMMVIPILTGIIIFLAISTLIFNRMNKKQWQSILLIGTLILLLCSLVLFIGAMSAFTEVGVGGLIGQGTLDVTIQGQDVIVPMLCQWGPGIGFWLYVLSSLILISTLIVIVYQKKEKR